MIKYFDSLKYELIEEKNYRLNHENLNIIPIKIKELNIKLSILAKLID